MEVIFNKVNKTFISSFTRKKVRAVADLNLSVKTGEILGIVGPNGAGKSTLLKMLMGFIRHDSGTIFIGEKSPSDPEARLQIGYLPENPYYYDHLSAEDLMVFSATTSGMAKQDIKHRIDTLLKTMNLEHARKRRLRTYSKGMMQRAGICFALVHDPDLIIFDEPMSGLDPLGRKLVVDMVLDLKNKGKTILFCSHILNDVERLCDRMAIMDKGYLKKILSRKELMAKLDVQMAKADGIETNILEKIFLDTIGREADYE
ncbi:MAG: ABC transporter ATP-binding protein [Deltaproteobacteria bacterium]|nr:ABC transporter ATP-binding protein [Deltaproteobacteria bacterium]